MQQMLWLFFPIFAPTAVRMPRFFGDGMVLQTRSRSGVRAFLSGWADPLEDVTVHISNPGPYSHSNYEVTANQDGAWEVQIHPGKYTPLHVKNTIDITVNGSNGGPAVTARNISFGDVFLCIGGTEMAKSAHSPPPPPNLRLFTVGAGTQSTPGRRDVPPNSKGWLLGDDPAAAPAFSAASSLCLLGEREGGSDKHRKWESKEMYMRACGSKIG